MMVFNQPRVKMAQQTLTAIIAILVFLLLGVTYLAQAYEIAAMSSESAGYQSTISQIVAAVAGRGVFYYVTIGFVLAVLALSAQTGFADFPRLCRLLASDNFLPHTFPTRGSRLVYSSGIVVLAVMSAILLIVFQGRTEGLIPLFAVGAFSAFTLSQAGMVVHWSRLKPKGWRSLLAVNLAGCIASGVALVVVLVAKFAEGAWIIAILIPILLGVFKGVHHHYRSVSLNTKCRRPLELALGDPPHVILPIQHWSTISEKALKFAMKMSKDVTMIHVSTDETSTDQLQKDWDEFVVAPLSKAAIPVPKLVIVPSPYRHVLGPILDQIRQIQAAEPNRDFMVVIPELVETKWWQHLLHNQRAFALKAALLYGGDARSLVVNVPWYAT